MEVVVVIQGARDTINISRLNESMNFQMTRPLFEAMLDTDRLEIKEVFRMSEQLVRETGVQMKLRNDHLRAALKETHPSLSESEIRRFRAM